MFFNLKKRKIRIFELWFYVCVIMLMCQMLMLWV